MRTAVLRSRSDQMNLAVGFNPRSVGQTIGVALATHESAVANATEPFVHYLTVG